MPIPTPFHSRTVPLCESWEWRDWAGYLAPSLYAPVSHAREYFAIRNSAALIDVSPLFKYEVRGPDALRLVNRVVTRDVARCAVGQAVYTPWCNQRGKLIDDGIVVRLEEQHFRITSAHPNLRWFQDAGADLEVEVVDVSQALAALSLQGPQSRNILRRVVNGVDFDRLGIFRAAQGSLDGAPLTVTRTGYTGDLGYELWLRPSSAAAVWDRIMAVGTDYGLLPAGMVALDMARIEAGLLLIDVDYISAQDALIAEEESSPYEVGLGWAVSLDKGTFIGREALGDEYVRGPAWTFMGLVVDWFELERLYGAAGLRPQVAGKRPARTPVPVHKDGRQIGQVTSQVFSPLLKQYIALGMLQSPYAHWGAQVDLEMTIVYRRETAVATLVKPPFFDPPRRRR